MGSEATETTLTLSSSILEAGEHTLIIKQRKDGTKIDRILITDDMEYAEGLGEIENSSEAYYEAEVMDLTFPMTLGTDTNAWGGENI